MIRIRDNNNDNDESDSDSDSSRRRRTRLRDRIRIAATTSTTTRAATATATATATSAKTASAAMQWIERRTTAGRDAVVVVFLLHLVVSALFFSGLSCCARVEAFRAAGPGGGANRKHEQQQQQQRPLLQLQLQLQRRFTTTPAFRTFTTSESNAAAAAATTTMRLGVFPLKLAGDNNNNNAASESDSDSDKSTTLQVANNNNNNNNNSTSQFLMNFNASESIGSLLMQMQKKEAELKKLNKSASLLLSEDQAVNLDDDRHSDRASYRNGRGKRGEAAAATTTTTTIPPTTTKNDLFSWMRKTDDSVNGNGGGGAHDPIGDAAAAQTALDDELARELDNSVSIRITSSVKDIALVESPEIYRINPRTTREVNGVDEGNNNNDDDDDTTGGPTRSSVGEEEPKTETKTTGGKNNVLGEETLPRLSRAEHYDGRIGRDMRHLAVSIASCIDSVEEWQLFCQQTTGGLEPLIECIREGAASIREGSAPPTATTATAPGPPSVTGTTYKSGFSVKEENFQAASSACRAIRDLCALSLDLASVITDGLLRANAAYKANGEEHTLMDDLCTILRHDDELSDLQAQLTDKVVVVAARNNKNNKREPGRRRKLFSLRRRNRDTPSPPEEESATTVYQESSPSSKASSKWPMAIFRERREARLRWKLYVTQLLLAMTCTSDSAVDAIRSTEGLKDTLLVYSSYARKERRRRWLRYPGEMIKSVWLNTKRKRKRGHRRNDSSDSDSSSEEEETEQRRQPFIEAASLKDNLKGRIKGTANQVLAAIGYNEWVPKIPGQKGLRILCLDGGGSRGMTSVVAMKCLVDSLGGMEVADCFDLVVGTSTGAIIAFLVGLNRETSEQAVERYDVLIEKIFTKSAFSTPMLLFTTASYDESPFMNVLTEILKDNTMLDSRANPAVPYVFAVTSKMSSNPTHVALFRNYNYNGGELPDPFMINPDDARENLGLLLENEAKMIRTNDYPKKKGVAHSAPGTITPDNGSRHPGSFRLLQKYALRASTAAPTVFKPVLMGGEMYCDGGIVASNPSAIAIHEARTIFPDVPIELVVSIGTGGFKEQKSEPRIGWDGIIGQIINSATDGEQIHHILEDVLGDGTTAQGKSSVSNTCYMRFNPILGMPDEFPIDVTDPDKLQQIKTITKAYMEEPEQKQKLQALSDILKGRNGNRF